jgi:hypothetical protein
MRPVLRADVATVTIVLKSESLSPLEPSGPVRTCAGIVSPLPFTNTLNRVMWRVMRPDRFVK